MTYQRSHLASAEEPGCYHVVSRCVRRAFLCGKDKLTGKCFEHRRQWIEDRILELAECFSVSVYAYSVVSNHWHLVLYVDPQQPWAMSDEEMARCWLKAFPGPLKHTDSAEMEGRFVQALLEPHAVLSCMAYVDLNPVRAAMCGTLIDSDYTSIQRRLKERESMTAHHVVSYGQCEHISPGDIP